MNTESAERPKQTSGKVLDRTTFETSRLMDFCSPKELTAQTGHNAEEWPLVILKECMDNALDACEEAGISPEVTVTVDEHGITIGDNGQGIPAETVNGILDYAVRVSSREAYVSPTRGAQGNAMKTILAMPFVLDGDSGRVDIAARGQRYKITFAVDRIAQRPAVSCETFPDENVKTGTVVRVYWPASASEILDNAKARFLQLADDYAWLNPHLTLAVDWHGDETRRSATSPDCGKWPPSEPTSAHWYGPEEFERLVAAYVAHDRARKTDRSVRELVKEFRGLIGTAKQRVVLEETGLTRTNLSALVNGNELQHAVLAGLLKSMQANSRAVKPAQLGIIGEGHVRTRFQEIGCDMATCRYRKAYLVGSDGLPMVVEAAFAMQGDDQAPRRLITGVNWSAGIINPFRNLGGRGGGWSDGLGALLESQRASHHAPIVFLLHVAHPRVRYTDRGKSAVAISRMDGDTIAKVVESVTADWKRIRVREERDNRKAMNRHEAFARAAKVSVKEAAWQVMRDAYLKASGSVGMATARQVFYQARGPIQEITGKTGLDSQYFSQTLLPEYQREHPKETADWDVLYDARGDFYEPHTGKSVPLGTLEVRGYLQRATWRGVAGIRNCLSFDLGKQDCGPRELFGALLYIEKQGFDELFRKVQLAERFDIGILSAKGQSVTACRHLADELCGTYGIPLLVLHDFDLAGLNILHTLCNDTRRYAFKNEFEVIDFGLRLEDAKAWGLDSERVCYGRNKNGEAKDPRDRLPVVGATEEEAKFLCSEKTGAGWCGRRVELNALTSDNLVECVESKLTAAGIQKVIPNQEALEKAYRRALQDKLINERMDAIAKATGDLASKAKLPANLDRAVRKLLKSNPAQPWGWAVATTAAANCKKAAGSNVSLAS
jgi:DNA topoisomerase VI subunit B